MRHTPDNKRLKTDLINYINNLPIDNFLYLSLIYLDQDNRSYLESCIYNFKSPVSIPLTIYSCAIASKGSLLHIISLNYEEIYNMACDYPAYTCIEYSNLYWDLVYIHLSRVLREDLSSTSCEILLHIKRIL